MSELWRVAAAALMGLAMMRAAQAQQAAAHIDAIAGDASLERLGEQPQLAPGTVIAERDVLEVARDSALRLTFLTGTFLELGGNSRLALEKLPVAGVAADRTAILSLAQGDLHLRWQPAENTEASNWRLVVYFGAQHAVLAPGDYYFSVTDAAQQACVAEGKLEIISTSSARLRTAVAHRCYTVLTGQIGRIEAIEPRAWAQVTTALKPLDRIVPPTPAIVELAPAAPPLAQAAQGQAGSEPSPAPVAASAAAAPPLPPVAAVNRENWALNLATLDDRSAAEKLAAQMSAAAYVAAVKTAVVSGKTVYRVQITGFDTAAAARAIEPELARKFGFKSLWPILQTP